MKNLFNKYKTIAIVANILTAVSISGLAVVGVLSSDIAFPLLSTLAIVFGLLGLAGRFIQEDLKDDGKPFYVEDDENAK